MPIRFEPATEAPRDEWFLAGTEAAVLRGAAQVGASAARCRRFGIASPRDGCLFALDPDMPPAAQRITFEGERGVWMLDGGASASPSGCSGRRGPGGIA